MIGTEEDLRARFGEVHPLAIAKTRPALDKYSRQFIAMSPFVVVSTADSSGKADLSPRGDPPGFVHVVDDKTILIPDRPGNNRLDTMANIVANPQVGCLFFIPGFEDTLRLNGRARITDDAGLLKPCTVNGKAPTVGILIAVEEVFIHCAKALKRSKLWDVTAQVPRTALASLGRMIIEQSKSTDSIPQVEERIEQAYREKLY